MQPGLGHILPFDAKDEGNAIAPKATDAPPSGKATNVTASTTIAATTLMPLTNSTSQQEKPTTKAATKGTTVAPKKPATSSLKGKGKKGFNGSLLDLEHPMWRMHYKRGYYRPAPTKAPLATSKAPNPYYYYNMAPPMMEGGHHYGLSPEVLSPELTGGSASLKHRRQHKPSPTLPPLLSMLQQQHHREKSPLLEFLDDVMDLVSSNHTKGIDSKPYGYYNKMVSPDGKHEVKEFGVLSPNMIIEGVQQEHNYNLLPADFPGEHNYGMSSEVLPPEFVPIKPKNMLHHREKANPHHDMLDGGIDAALRKNYELIERLLEDLEQEDDLLQVIKDATFQMKKTKKDNVQPKHYAPQEELIVSCPVHHEHHPNRNGEMIEEDVVQVSECEAVKVQD